MDRPEYGAAVQQAALAGLGTHLALLRSDDGKVRAAAGHLLGIFAERPEVVAALAQALEVEESPTVRAGLLLALGRAGGGHAPVHRLAERGLASSDPGERLAGALAISRLPGSPRSAEAARVMAAALADGERTELLADLPWDVEGEESLSKALGRLGPAGAEAALPILEGALPAASPVDGSYLVEALLAVACEEERRAPVTAEALDARQRRVLRAIASADRAWQTADLWSADLDWCGLPADRRALRALAEDAP